MIGTRIQIQGYGDERGMLMAINHIPFNAKRIFFISEVPEGAVRGNHFSKTSSFLYVVIRGGCKVELNNISETENFDLNAGDGLVFSKNTWIKINNCKKDTILCVLADTEYRMSDYVSDYSELQRIVEEENV